ncbi:hypothetical protein V6N00_03090 [Tersicoccus sp. MR15.9]|uniref:DsrE family protein n=1 Tax=Tersicoccus mangrovi TaxID=3121635 RepID=UPI002FE6BC3B
MSRGEDSTGVATEGEDSMTANGSAGLLLHVFGGDPAAVAAGARVAQNARRDLGPVTAVELVVQGGAVRGLIADSEPAASLAPLDDDAGIAVLACENSMRSADVEAAALRAGVGTVPAAVGHLARRQWEGWAYVRL